MPRTGISGFPTISTTIASTYVLTFVCCLPPYNEREFPGEVITILNARVHALCAGGRVNVGCVPSEETTTGGELVDVACVDLVRGEPLDIVHVHIEFRLGLNSRFDLLIKNIAFVFVELFRKHTDDTVAFFASKRKENNEGIGREAHVQRLMAHLPIDLRVGNVKNPFERAAFEGQPKCVTNQALRTVTTNNVLSRDGPGFFVSRF